MYRNCLYCGKRIFVEPSEQNLPESDFCSDDDCEDKWYEKEEEEVCINPTV